jgi:dimeric dUTPase (all-alpha-NTP-PPase superfamily)
MAIHNLRTIKRMISLSAAGTSNVTNYKFRSLQEIEQFIEGVRKTADEQMDALDDLRRQFPEFSAVTIKPAMKVFQVTRDKTGKLPSTKIDFVAPKLDNLRKHFDVIENLHDKVQSLDSVINTLQLQFRGTPGSTAVINNAKKLRDDLQKKVSDAYKFLENVATKHEPKAFASTVARIVKEIKDVFKENFSKSKEFVYRTPYEKEGKTHILFTHYLQLDDFIDDNDYTHARYFIVFSCLMSPKGEATYFVTLLQEFAPPGRFSLGQTFETPKEGQTKAFIQLESEKFSTLIERVTVPSTKEELENINWAVSKDWIKTIEVNKDIIEIQFTSKVTQKNVQEAANKIVMDLKAFLIGKSKASIRTRIFKRDTRNFGVELVLVIPSRAQLKEIRVDGRKVQRLKDSLGLSEKQTIGLVKYLNKLAEDESQEIR